MGALSTKRLNAEGAALFSVLSRRHDAMLLRLLVSFQVLLDFLDSASERRVPRARENGAQLHLALVEALQPDAPMSDYYRYHPWRDDGGYLHALVGSCREAFAALPSRRQVSPLVVRAARQCAVQGINHDPDPKRRELALELWARRELAKGQELSWWELTAAASSTLGVHALLAQAAQPDVTARDASSVGSAYMPWACAASTMLDSYVDEALDAVTAGHSYVRHYASPVLAVRRVCDLIRRSLCEAGGLPDGARHVLIVAAMTAMYLSADEARTPAMRSTTARLVEAGGSLTRLLVPILRLWRVASARGAA